MTDVLCGWPKCTCSLQERCDSAKTAVAEAAEQTEEQWRPRTSERADPTPPPWSPKFDEAITICAADGSRIAILTHLTANSRRDTNEVEATARLMSAAPDMLAALRCCVNWFGSRSGSDDALLPPTRQPEACIFAAMRAIAKATGESTP